MDLPIKNIQSITYTNTNIVNDNNTKNTKAVNFDLEADKKITEDEDKRLFDYYENSTLAQLNGDFEDFKRKIDCFPPINAPGIVRKEWREKWENASEAEKNYMRGFTLCYDIYLNSKDNKYKDNMPKDFNGYLNFMDDMKKYIEGYNISGVDKQMYEGMKNVADTFDVSLKKYVS